MGYRLLFAQSRCACLLTNTRCVNRKIVKIKQNKQMTLKKPRLGRTSLQPMIDAKIVYDIK